MTKDLTGLIFSLRMRRILRNLAEECQQKEAVWREKRQCKIYNHSPLGRDYNFCEYLKEGKCNYIKSTEDIVRNIIDKK